MLHLLWYDDGSLHTEAEGVRHETLVPNGCHRSSQKSESPYVCLNLYGPTFMVNTRLMTLLLTPN
jgi:hypothetical protein